MSKFRVVVASTNRKVKTVFEKDGGLPKAKEFADGYKLEHGVNCNVIEFREVYTTTTIDEAEAEARALEESRARNPAAHGTVG